MQDKQLARNEGIMLSTLFGCGGMKHGNHHLYDELQDGVGARGELKKKDENIGDPDVRDDDFD